MPNEEMIPILTDEIADKQAPVRDVKGWTIAIIFAAIASAYIVAMACELYRGKL